MLQKCYKVENKVKTSAQDKTACRKPIVRYWKLHKLVHSLSDLQTPTVIKSSATFGLPRS